MCMSLVLYDSHPALLLLLTFNRDEFWERPTQPAHFWPDEPCLLAGRDALRKGTWLGVTRHGRFALITNFREPMDAADPTKFVKSTTAPSRGALTTDFLTGTMGPLEYLQGLALASYCGFNLLVGDLHSRQVAYVSNRDPQGPRLLGPGHYGISNGLLQEWPKVQKGRAALASVLDLQEQEQQEQEQQEQEQQEPPQAQPPPQQQQQQQQHTGQQGAASSAGGGGGGPSGGEQALPWQVLFHHVMGDRQLAPLEQVPLTGVGQQLDHRLSSAFIEPFELQPGEPYGTRSQTVIAVWRDGRVEQRERYVEKVPAGSGSQGQGSGGQGQGGGGQGSGGQGSGGQGSGGDDDKQGDDEEVTWVWREQVHEFELTAPPPAAGGQQQQGQQEQQGQQQGSAGAGAGAAGDHWHMAKGHLHHAPQGT